MIDKAGDQAAELTVLESVETETDKIGDVNSQLVVPYVLGYAENKILAHLNTSYFHAHGKAFVYPDHADDVLLTSSAAAWSETGAIIEVIPVGGLLAIDFDIHWINLSNLSANGTYQVDVFKGAPGSEIRIGATRANRSTNQTRNGPSRIQIPQQVIDERISCRLSDSTSSAQTLLVSFEGHYYHA